MNRIVEIVAMAVGGLSLFLVAFVGFVSLSGRDVSQVAVLGKLFPAQEEGGEDHVTGEQHATEANDARKDLSDAAVVEASLGVLSAWTLPSPYSTSELRVLSEEIKKKRAELDGREGALARRERAVQEDERELEERLGMLAEMRAEIEALQVELAQRESELALQDRSAEARKDAGWAEVGRVFATIDDAGVAAQKLQEYEPEEAAKILRALGDDARAGEILNAVAPARWKEYVGAYTAEKSRATGKASKKK